MRLIDFGLVAGDVIDENRIPGFFGITGKARGNYFGYLTRFHSMLELVQSTLHAWTSSRMKWLHLNDGLHEYPEGETESGL